MQMYNFIACRNGGYFGCIHYLDGTYILLMQQNPYKVQPFFSFPFYFYILWILSLFCECFCLFNYVLHGKKLITTLSPCSHCSSNITGKSDDIWSKQVVEPAVKIIRSFLSHDANSVSDDVPSDTGTKILARDLWTQYVCEVSNTLSFFLLSLFWVGWFWRWW